MNLVNITDNDLINISKLLNGDGLTDDLLEELTNKLDYCVTQIKIRNEYMDKVEEVNKEYKDKLKEKEDKENGGE